MHYHFINSSSYWRIECVEVANTFVRFFDVGYYFMSGQVAVVGVDVDVDVIS